MVLIEVGAEAPDFSLLNDEGDAFHLSDLRGQLRAMLVFYPKDFTPGCTDQLIQVRRNIKHLRQAGIEPMGINYGDAESHQAFRKEHALNFDLLVDEDNAVARPTAPGRTMIPASSGRSWWWDLMAGWCSRSMVRRHGSGS